MLEAGLQLHGLEPREAEVVEQILPQLEVSEALHWDEQQQRLEGQVSLAQAAAQGEGGVRILVRADDCARPTLVGLEARRGLWRGRRLPWPASEVEGLGERRRRGVRKE